ALARAGSVRQSAAHQAAHRRERRLTGRGAGTTLKGAAPAAPFDHYPLIRPGAAHITTTLAPTATRPYKSMMSALRSRMQPDDTSEPMVQGSLEPWMRYSVDARYIARAPSGFSGPPAM